MIVTSLAETVRTFNVEKDIRVDSSQAAVFKLATRSAGAVCVPSYFHFKLMGGSRGGQSVNLGTKNVMGSAIRQRR